MSSLNQFTLIMPTYNRGYIIWKTIQSILVQTFHAWELLIIDDGSTDHTSKVVAQFSDPRIKYFKKTNGGAAQARNFGLRHVKSGIIGYIDSDDPVFPHFLDSAYKKFSNDAGCQFAIANHEKSIELYDQEERLIGMVPPEPAAATTISVADLYLWKFKSSGTGIFHRYPLIKNIAWNETLKLMEDFEFILQLASAYPEGFRFIDESQFRYSQRYGGDGACSNATYLDYSRAFQQVYDLHRNDRYIVAEVFTDRVPRYKALHEQVARGEIPPPHLKYFPQYWNKS